MDAEEQTSWYAVRSVFRAQTTAEFAPDDLADGESAYEERITLWQATTFDEAIDLAEAEAIEYAEFMGVEYLADFGQAYNVADVPPRNGTEIFSLTRYSPLPPEPYIETFFDTGRERQQ
ncbi:MAG: hypothetical protein QOJ68_3562 [Blastococcus sp.]|jgi:hypothetical protein|nr:hypothetical protein [Blastococcus sp.]